MRRPERATPLPDQLGGETEKGRCGTKGRASGARSVLRPGVEGVSPSADAPGAMCGVSVRFGAVGRVATGSFPNPLPADPLLLPPAEGVGLPCLSSNNCNGEGAERVPCLSQQHKKSACALAWNVQHMAEQYGLARLGFLTLTFADHVLSPKEAQRRFHSLRTGVLSKRYEAFLRVLERQKSGRIHYHLLVVLPFDARTGVDFEAFGRGEYQSASTLLRSEWAFWRRTSKAYRFGRTELMPVRSTEEGIGRYVGKYISKHHAARKIEDKGVRLVEYSTGARMARTRFGWCSDNAAEWRAKVRVFAQIMGERYGVTISAIEDLTAALGPRWAYHWREFIASLPAPTAPLGYAIAPDGHTYSMTTGEVVTKA